MKIRKEIWPFFRKGGKKRKENILSILLRIEKTLEKMDKKMTVKIVFDLDNAKNGGLYVKHRAPAAFNQIEEIR